MRPALTVCLTVAVFLCLGAGEVSAPLYPSETPFVAIVATIHAEAPHPAVPVKLSIPRIALEAQIDPVALTSDGKPDIPEDPTHVAWFSPGPKPGEKGAAIIDGLLDTAHGPAVFAQLHAVQPGDAIAVTDAEGTQRTFRVERTEYYHVRTAPIHDISSGTGTDLRLITCAGKWDTQLGHYDQRLVVFAQMPERL